MPRVAPEKPETPHWLGTFYFGGELRGIVNLPEKHYYRIEEVVERWREKSHKGLWDGDIVDYIRQGILPAYIYSGGTYYLIPEDELFVFDGYTKYEQDFLLRFFDNDFLHKALSSHDTHYYLERDVFIRSSDLIKYEEVNNVEAGNFENNDKFLTTKERKSLHLIIAALIELAEYNIEQPYVAAKDIMYKIKESSHISENTVASHLKAAKKTASHL